MMKKCLSVILMLLFAAPVWAANHYVRAGASGAADGSNWTDAWTSLPSPLTRGDTYYMADGTYGGYTFDDAVSGSTYITIKKAIESDHGTETGWVSTYGDGQTVWGERIFFNTNYWVFDGQVGGGPGSWTSGYGFYIDVTGANNWTGMSTPDFVDFITVSHVEIEGHGDEGPNPGSSQDGININDGGFDGPKTFSYIWIHDTGRTPVFNRSHDVTFEYMYIGKFESTSDQHSEASAMWINLSKGVTPVENVVWRWGILTHFEGTGGIIMETDSADIYGNIFIKHPGGECSSSGNGQLGGWSDRTFSGVNVYNNSFIDTQGCATLVKGAIGVAGGTSVIAKNNLWINAAADLSEADTVDYNEFINMYTAASPNQGSNASTHSTSPYNDADADDYTMIRATVAGATLGTPYDVDMYGNTRGADGTWDRGAVEYTGTQTPPGDVTSQSATGGDQQVTLNWTNPADADFAGARIRFRTDRYPTGPTNGTLVADNTGSASAADSQIHGSLDVNQLYYYSIYAYDASNSYASGVTTSASTDANSNMHHSFKGGSFTGGSMK